MRATKIARFKTQCHFEGSNIDYDIKFDDVSKLHCHDFFEVFCVIDGKYKHTINGRKEILSAGDGYLLRPFDTHMFRGATDNVKRLNIAIKKNYFKKSCDLYSASLYKEITKLKSIKITILNDFSLKIISYLSNRDIKDENKNQLIEKYAVNSIIELFIDSLNIIQDEAPIWFKELTNEMHSSKNMKWKVDDVMKKSNYSKTHMERIFKKYTGKTIIQYLTAIKMDLATKYLSNSSMSISEVAFILGYENYTYFTHLFKKTFNMSPAQYKKSRINYSHLQ